MDCCSVSKSILPQLVGATTSHEAWDKLFVAYESGSRPYICELTTQLHTLSHYNAILELYLHKEKGIAHKLVVLQVPNDNMVEFVLAGLGPSFCPFTRTLESQQ